MDSIKGAMEHALEKAQIDFNDEWKANRFREASEVLQERREQEEKDYNDQDEAGVFVRRNAFIE